MIMKRLERLFLTMLVAALVSCNSNDDAVEAGIEIPGITITDDADCCSAEEALQVYNFLQTVKIVPELQTVVDGKYNVFVYTPTGDFHQGYNDVYFVATKRSSGNYVKDFNVNNITPLMTMTKMGMQHSTPVGSSIESFNDGYLAVKHGWVSLLMPTSENGTWQISYSATVLGKQGGVTNADIAVAALPDGQEWIKSFKNGDDTYFLSLVNPGSWKTGTNAIRAYVSKKSSDVKSPYKLAAETFTIDIDPRMPDMDNHTSPDNVALKRRDDGSYEGLVNLTMTGRWRIHLTVRDAEGNIVAGGDTLDDGFSSLYWDVTI